jgi:acyl carrier protein
MEFFDIQDKIKKITIEVLKLGVTPAEISVETPFFSTSPDRPGLIEDSLAILEISSCIAEEFDIAPGELREEDFQNISTLSSAIAEKVNV